MYTVDIIICIHSVLYVIDVPQFKMYRFSVDN